MADNKLRHQPKLSRPIKPHSFGHLRANFLLRIKLRSVWCMKLLQ